MSAPSTERKGYQAWPWVVFPAVVVAGLAAAGVSLGRVRCEQMIAASTAPWVWLVILALGAGGGALLVTQGHLGTALPGMWGWWASGWCTRRSSRARPSWSSVPVPTSTFPSEPGHLMRTRQESKR